jgi:hypothetical protein
MFADQFARRLQHKVMARKAKIEVEVANGAAKDFAEYKLFVGRVRGLGEVEDLIREVAKEMEIEADE